jgi:uncharacterized membrane protein YjjB (DUF3815 family)
MQSADPSAGSAHSDISFAGVGFHHAAFAQPFCAALIAGSIGAVAVRLQLSSALRLVALCPCMVLVPGPHLLNGTLDLVRGRLPLGASRIGYASLTILMICAGLLVGLSLGGVSLPASGTLHSVPLGYDVIAAGGRIGAAEVRGFTHIAQRATTDLVGNALNTLGTWPSQRSYYVIFVGI